jgi:hypothetical protein
VVGLSNHNVQTAAGYAALKSLGITAGMVEVDSHDASSIQVTDNLDALLSNDLPWYVENIATDFYSSYHRWSGDRSVNWRFLETKQRYWANPVDIAALSRVPSLSDPDWLNAIEGLRQDVRELRRYRPLYYNLGDETGIADLAAVWDFDFSAACSGPFRTAERSCWRKRRICHSLRPRRRDSPRRHSPRRHRSRRQLGAALFGQCDRPIGNRLGALALCRQR